MDISDIIRAAGGPNALGKEIGRSHVTVLRWRQVPAQHVLSVERLTGISRHILRPDVFGAAPANDDPEPPPGGASAKHPEKQEAA